MRSVLSILFFVVTSFSFSQQIDFENKLLWEISKKGSAKKGYLFGSFHTNDKRVFNLSDSVYFALNHTDVVAVETDIYALFKDIDTRKDPLVLNFDKEGQAYTGSQRPSLTSYGDENGMPQFLDLYFLQYALLAGKDYYALEPLEDQLKLTESSIDFSTYSYADKFFNLTEKTMNIYLKGDIYALDRMMKLGTKFNPELFDKLIIQRNIVMASSIDSLLKSKSAFIAIGAAHLAGEKGIINLLRSKGYYLRPVVSLHSDPAPIDKQQVLSYKNFLFYDSISQFRALFPGKPFEIDREDVALNLIYREMGQGNSYMIELIERQEGQSLESVADDYIQSPGDSKKISGMLDYGTPFIEGISDSYPEGFSWVRVLETDGYFAVLKAYGGNKFMNSKRAQVFFNNCWFEFD